MHGRERLRAGDSAGAIQDLEASLRERALPADRRRKALERSDPNLRAHET